MSGGRPTASAPGAASTDRQGPHLRRGTRRERHRHGAVQVVSAARRPRRPGHRARQGDRRNDDPVVRQEIAKLLTLSKSAEWTARRARAAQLQGRPQGPEGSLGKLAVQPRGARRGEGAHADHRRGRHADRRGRPDERPDRRDPGLACRRGRSPAAPTKSSATSSLNGCWGCRRSRAPTMTGHSAMCRRMWCHKAAACQEASRPGHEGVSVLCSRANRHAAGRSPRPAYGPRPRRSASSAPKMIEPHPQRSTWPEKTNRPRNGQPRQRNPASPDKTRRRRQHPPCQQNKARTDASREKHDAHHTDRHAGGGDNRQAGPTADDPSHVDAGTADIPWRMVRHLCHLPHRLHRAGHVRRQDIHAHHRLRCSASPASRRSSRPCSPACSSAQCSSPRPQTASAAAPSSPIPSSGTASPPWSWRSSTTPEGVNLWRLIAGIGIGVELVTVDTFISELVPKRARGKTFAIQQSIGFIPVPLVALLAWLLNPTAPFGLSGWRWVVIIGSVGAIIVWFVRLKLPESPAGSPSRAACRRPTV